MGDDFDIDAHVKDPATQGRLHDDAQRRRRAKTAHQDNVVPITPPRQKARIVLSLAEFLAQYEPPSYIIDQIVQSGYLYSMTGATGSGKTAIALLISIYVCLGGRKLGPHEIDQGRVLYITTENPLDVRMRLIGMAQQMAFDPASIDRNFLVIQDMDAGLTLETVSQIKTEVGEVGDVALVVVDTSSALFRGSDDNINTEMISHARRQRLLCALPGRPAVITLPPDQKCGHQRGLNPARRWRVPRRGRRQYLYYAADR
jgi:hypothetical protein